MNIKEKVLDMIKSSDGGILQRDIWENLGIDSKKCSRIVMDLEREGLIRREWEKLGGTRSYRIFYRFTTQYDFLFANGQISPCIGCFEECDPEDCEDLDSWIQYL